MLDKTLDEDEKYMRRALQLARCGSEYASPNPMVGAVVVADGRIIGEGYHRRCGGPHAEVHAIHNAQSYLMHNAQCTMHNCHSEDTSAQSATAKPNCALCIVHCALKEATIYVTLEPCAHYGRTPPCAQLIIDVGVKRVVVGCRDPFAKVDGLGIKMLRDAGIEVTVGVLENECRALNRRFMTFHSLHRPFVTLKWAQSQDHYIDRKRECAHTYARESAVRLSDHRTTQICHRRRAEHDAIMVGWRTAVMDNPSLTTRLWPGSNPLRVVLDRDGSLKTMTSADGKPLTLFCDNQAETLALATTSPAEILKALYDRGVQSVLIEGGAATLQSFIDADLWDEAYVETSPQLLHDGVAAPVLTTC